MELPIDRLDSSGSIMTLAGPADFPAAPPLSSPAPSTGSPVRQVDKLEEHLTKARQVCHRLEKWLRDNVPAALGSFKPGATSTQIAAHERGIEFILPEDVRGWFRWRDGQKGGVQGEEGVTS